VKKKIFLLTFLGTALMFHSLSAQTWSETKRLTWSVEASSYPSIAIDSSNNIHVIWQDNTPGNSEIYYKKSSNGGVSWSGAKRLTWTSGSSGTPAISTDSSDNIHVVWYDNSPGESEIYYKKSTDGGASWTGAKRLTWNLAGSFFPSIVADSNDNIHLAWHSFAKGQGAIYYSASVDCGVSWSGAKRLTWNSGSSVTPQMTADSGNNIQVVWFDYSPGEPEIYYKRSTNRGVSWAGTKRLTWNSGYSIDPRMTVDSSNNIHVTWSDRTPGNPEIYYKKGYAP